MVKSLWFLVEETSCVDFNPCEVITVEDGGRILISVAGLGAGSVLAPAKAFGVDAVFTFSIADSAVEILMADECGVSFVSETSGVLQVDPVIFVPVNADGVGRCDVLVLFALASIPCCGVDASVAKVASCAVDCFSGLLPSVGMTF